MLLDGASMWFRSYFALPSSITAPDGRPVNAVRGFLDSMAKVIDQHRPGRLAVCLDLDWRPQFRVDLIPSYKAHRVAAEVDELADADTEEVPDDLSPQVEMITEILAALGVATAGAPGFEADDVIGTLAGAERRDPVVAVSGDRDLLQLVADEPVPVRVLYLGRGMANATLFGPAEVSDKYGIPPERAGDAYAELALLRGDPSDGLPGVPGVGEKTAATMLSRYGSLERILAAAADPESDLPRSFRARIVSALDYIEAALPVVFVARDAPVELSTTDDRLPKADVDPAGLSQLAERYGVVSSVGRLQQAMGLG